MLQAFADVYELLIQAVVVLAEHSKSLLPLVSFELVEAFVVEYSGHFGDRFLSIRTADGGFPFLWLARL